MRLRQRSRECARIVGVLVLALASCGGENDKVQEDFGSPAAVRAAIAATPERERWAMAFAAGELAGQGSDLRAAAEQVTWFGDPTLMQHFWDGFAHGAASSSDEPAYEIAEIRRLTGAEAHIPLEDGLLMHFTMRHAEDVAAVERYATLWSALTRRSPVNGVRVGLQRALGDDLPHAIDVATRYPSAWQHDIYEELGWRLGSVREPAHSRLRAALTRVPADSWCWFTHGVVRGRALHVSLDEAVALLPSAPDACRPMGWHAIGWSLRTQYGEDRSRVDAYAVGLEPPQRNALMRGYEEQLQPSLMGPEP